MNNTLHELQVLLADSDVIQAETVADTLRSDGLRVVSVFSGDDAVSAIRQKTPPFDILVTSLAMPNNTCFDVIKAALEHNPNCSILVLSSYSTASEAAEAISMGAYMAITKPHHPVHFRNALKRLAERASLLSEKDYLAGRVAELESKVESLEATKGRMEMLAQQISPARYDQMDKSFGELEQLAALRKKGILTEDQFQTARQFILRRWSH
ncbi:MAG: response regulator [Holophagales bacterium]|jgi:DNA-binding NtrC family response regulator|nr:response regulator [Holophagales bacterium]